jgi:hypothetical protein
MDKVLNLKFSQNDELLQKLLQTEDTPLLYVCISFSSMSREITENSKYSYRVLRMILYGAQGATVGGEMSWAKCS